MKKHGFTWIGFLVVIAVIIIFLGCFAPVAGKFAAEILSGWVVFLIRVVPEIQFSWSGLATAGLCLVILGWGSHRFLCWLYGHRQPTDKNPPTWSRRWTLSLLSAIVLMFVAGLAVMGLAHQVAWLATSREPLVQGGIPQAAARTISMNNLKQIALALHGYNDYHKKLPPGGAFDQHGRGLHGWQTFLLPYVEQGPLYQLIKLDQPWDHPDNLNHFQTVLSIYINPMATSPDKDKDGLAFTHYAGNPFVLGGNKKLSIPRDFSDGTSNTILAGEAAANYKPWGSPTNWRDPALGINKSPDGFGNPRKGFKGANFALADGSVRFISEDVSPRVLKALCTPAGGERIESKDWE